MLKIILFSLLFLVTKNEQNLSLPNDMNTITIKQLEHGTHNRKLLNMILNTTLATTENNNNAPSKPPTRASKGDRAWLYTMIVVASVAWIGVFLKTGCIIHRKCKERQQFAMAHEIEIGKNNNNT